ncbi:MAG TPA: hypothetical protein DEB73_03490 [Candidatus Magasanikbacteria bacterium]|uniref:O-antigen polymerase family protein n=2 Tax=Candidatus Magasanikiibacteriota TaxID=1752731 RepID=A0A0G1CAQ6_9BACT|nr:MAG: O-antigen polymerase family protein [Candidatus Magasanikbacteria bacterium GW2011_GWC2_41_17]KKS55776.1 MAG: O-antigen polymerase family protein [Candidatus Magasanikbacteria bacterium GW2011_GWA2_42_32]HBV58295.1 hypothetical protein [Candidatus Magasanikbacteria bacterium]HBX16119.1 hypothetical protein [Candidatus Magasanikbacteria bacterium]
MQWLFYLLIFLAPFLGLVVDWHSFQWARQIPYLGSFDAPAADFLAMIVLAGGLFTSFKSIKVTLRHAGFFFFLPFLVISVLSLWQVAPDQFNSSLKYLLRPILFFYLMWVALPIMLIDSEKILNKVIKIFFWTGLLSALMGFISLFFGQSIFGFWQRATPISFWGLAPLGFNHNLLAEVLVATSPLAFYLFVRHFDQAKKFYFFSSLLIAAIALLTFARAAWLALAAQLLIYFLLSHNGQEKLRHLRQWALPALLIIPLAVYMFLFSISPIVQSSNSTRLDLTGIAWTYFKMHPWFGNGVGTFVPLVESTRLFTVEYGDPLDAHGVIQKIMAEQGLLGLITFFIFISWILSRIWRGWRAADSDNKLLLLCFFMSVSGSLIYQLFNTSYYNTHLWLPVGLALAAVNVIPAKAGIQKIYDR